MPFGINVVDMYLPYVVCLFSTFQHKFFVNSTSLTASLTMGLLNQQSIPFLMFIMLLFFIIMTSQLYCFVGGLSEKKSNFYYCSSSRGLRQLLDWGSRSLPAGYILACLSAAIGAHLSRPLLLYSQFMQVALFQKTQFRLK